MVTIKRIYEAASKKDGRRILVDRLWPRGIRKDEAGLDEWLKDIAPSDELRKWFSHDPSRWHEFRDRCRKELRDRSELVDRLRIEAKKETVTLLFAAKDVTHNNAVVLKEVLDSKGKERVF